MVKIEAEGVKTRRKRDWISSWADDVMLSAELEIAFEDKYGKDFGQLAAAFAYRAPNILPQRIGSKRSGYRQLTLRELDLAFAQAFTTEIEKHPRETREDWKEEFRKDLHALVTHDLNLQS